MHAYMKTTALAAIVWLACIIQLRGQPSWEGGFLLGGASYQGDLVETLAPEIKEIGPALGLYTRFYLSPQWSLRPDFRFARFSGSDEHFSDPGIRENRGFSFESWMGQGALLVEFDLLGKRRFTDSTGMPAYRKRFSPFVFGGVGAAYLNAAPDFGKNGGDYPSGVQEDRQMDFPHFRLALPSGLGLRWDLSEKFSLSATLTAHYLLTDYLDGISEAGNPDSRDWLWSGGLELNFRLTPKDSDKDGIVDKKDACPWLAGNISANGCPDMDGDGVEDAEDVCPEVPGLFENNGCPDRDGDGIMDLIDDCPDIFGFEETGGCPDRDNDCIADAEDECPDAEGLAAFAGCPDTDADGIPDNLDPCPTEQGLVENGGCPLPDTDCDGLVDREDDCPRMDGGQHMAGCPDTDEDGLADNVDKCPELAGDPENGGCPSLEEAEKELVANAKSSIRFKTGSAILLPESKQVLDSIVELMRKYPFYHLRIEGYTDNRGNDESNLRLSEQRANSCYDYLLYRGIGPVRMSYQGFGESDPIGDNDTETGRRLNRRVEFEMHMPDEL